MQFLIDLNNFFCFSKKKLDCNFVQVSNFFSKIVFLVEFEFLTTHNVDNVIEGTRMRKTRVQTFLRNPCVVCAIGFLANCYWSAQN